MPVRHLVLLQFQPTVDAATQAELAADFAGLAELIPQVAALEWGQNHSVEGLDKGFSHCFMLTFADAAARDAYLSHPAHQAFVAKLRPQLGDVLVLDYHCAG